MPPSLSLWDDRVARIHWGHKDASKLTLSPRGAWSHALLLGLIGASYMVDLSGWRTRRLCSACGIRPTGGRSVELVLWRLVLSFFGAGLMSTNLIWHWEWPQLYYSAHDPWRRSDYSVTRFPRWCFLESASLLLSGSLFRVRARA